MKEHKEEKKQKYKKICVAKYGKPKRYQSLPSLSNYMMAQRAAMMKKEYFQTNTKVFLLYTGHRANRVT
jgi:hypothetical protein